MIRRMAGQLPAWARPEHPVLRYELGKSKRLSTRARLLRLAAMAIGVILLGVAGYLIATGLLTHPPGQSVTESIHAVMFWPLLAVQFLTGIAALTLTASTVADEIQRRNWDNLRSTALGAELALHARWAATFYRLRYLLGAILLLRLVLVGGILYDLTAFQGRYLDLLMNGIAPELPLVAGVLLLSLLMTGALIAPVTAVGFDGALGLLLSVVVRQRTYSILLQVLATFIRLAITAGLLHAMTQFMRGALAIDGAASWLLAAGYGGLADWGLAFLDLGVYGELWVMVPFGIMLGLALLLFALFQAFLADQMIALAVRYSERHG
ncbi:MAG: hypothetical protein DIU68_008630 [Chloroflexota bacterium]